MVSSVPVVGRSSTHLFPQVVRVTLPDGLLAVACCIQDSSHAHERVAHFVEFVEEVAHLPDHELVARMRERCEAEQGLVSFAFARTSQAQVIVGAMGDGSVTLRRKEKQKRIVQGPEFRLLQGGIHAGDLIFVETGPMSRISASVAPHATQAVEVAEELGVLLANPESELGVAGVFIQVEKQAGKHKKSADTMVVPESKIKSVMNQELDDVDRPNWMAEAGDEQKKRRPKNFSWKAVMSLGLVLLAVVLAGSIAIGLKKEEARKRKESFDTALQPILELYSLAQSKEQIDVVKTREYTQQALDQIQSIVSSQKVGSEEAQRAKKTQEELQRFAERISEEKRFASIEPFFDLRLIQPDFRAGALALSGDTAYILNQKNGKVYSLDVNTKRANAIESEGGTSASLIVPVGKSIYSIGSSIQRSGKTVFAGDSNWSTPVAAGWYSGNLYVADSGSGMVRKFSGADSKTTELQAGENWLKSEATASIDNWVSMAIDGRIWIGTKNGKVLRYLQGKNDPFALKGVEPEFTGPIKIAMADTDFLYILDAEGARIVVCKKTGEFVQAYKVPAIAGASGFAITADGKTAYVSVDTLVYKLPLE